MERHCDQGLMLSRDIFFNIGLVERARRKKEARIVLDEWAENVYGLVKGDFYVTQDVPRWGGDFIQAWKARQEFRSIVKYRVRRTGDKDLINKFSSICHGKSWAFVNNFYLQCESVGPGVYVEHGFSTIIYAEAIGEKFRVNQNVTVGSNRGGAPYHW